VVGTGLVLAAAALLVLLRSFLLEDVDAAAQSRLHDVAVLAAEDRLPPTLSGDDDTTVAQVLAGDSVVAQSSAIQGTLASFTPAGAAVVVRTVDNPPIGDGGAYRVAASRVDSPNGTVVVYAAASLEPVDETMAELQLLLLGTVPVLIALVGITTWKLVGRTLEPVEAIRRQVAEISASALDRRVPDPGTADEIGRLARTMNDMLGRLDDAARRQRSFVADASHELRSPLAAIRTQLEVAAGHPSTVDWSALVTRWLAEQDRLERLVDDLLTLARLDGSPPSGTTTTVDLDELVLRELRDIRARGRVRLDLAGLGGGRVRGDPEQLRRLVRNLLDNAERHASGTVRVSLRQADGTVELAVGDDGAGIAVENRERVFRRFVRLDEARSRLGGGTGLGLAIVRDVATAHAGTVEILDAAPGATFVVRLPAVD
jgi:signal transduction histidine kinase